MAYVKSSDQTLFSRIPLREEGRYLLAYSYIYQSDLSSCGQALYLTILENPGIYQMRQVKYSIVNSISYKILGEISPVVSLFEDNPFMNSFTAYTPKEIFA